MKPTTTYHVTFIDGNWQGKLGSGEVFVTNPSKETVILRTIGMANYSLPSHIQIFDEHQELQDEYFYGTTDM